ncbi:MAG: T9SS type A sorting domain-containing protein, partial [Elusimicrobiota bacterium]
SCSVSIGVAEINRVKVNRTGSSIDSDVKAVWIYKDEGNGDFNGEFDAALGSAAFSGGVAAVNITTMTLAGGATSIIFVVYEVSPAATAGNTLGAGFTNSAYFRMGSLVTSVNGNFPFNTAAAPIQVTINPLLVESAFDVTTGELFQGATNNAALKLTVRSELNPVSWTALRVKKTGTLADSYVDAVKVFRDADGDGALSAGDELITGGSDVFVTGEVNLSFNSQQSVDAVGGRYFVALDLDPDSPYGSTLGVEVSTTGWFAINSPNYVSTASAAAPYTGGPALVKQYPNVVTVSTSGIVPTTGIFPGSGNIPVMKLTLKTDISKADLLSIRFSKTGTLTDSEVKTVKIYYDSNSLGVFNPNNLAAYALVSPSTVSYGTDGQLGIVQLNLDVNREITTAGKNYFVAIDLSTSAVIGRSMVMRAPDNSYFTVSAPNTVAALSFNSQAVTVMAPPQTLSVTFENKLSTYVIQGAQSVLVASFTVSASSYTIDVSQMKAARSGSGFDSDISSIKLYRDNGNGFWGGISEETLLSALAFSGGMAAFSHSAQSIVSPNRYTYYIVADISETAANGKTFGVDVPAVGYFTVNDPHSVGSVNFPYTGQTAVIQATVDTMIVDPVNAAPSLKQADSAKVMGRLRLRTNARSAAFVSLRIDKAGATPDADIHRIRLYKDDGDLALDSGDELVGTLTSLASGSGVMIVSPAQSITTTQKDYLVTVDIATYAVVGSSFSLALLPAALPPDTISITGSTAVFTMAGAIQDNPDMVYLDFASLAAQSLYLGASDVQMAKLSLRTDQDSALMTTLKFDFTGTAGPSDITAIKLYRDTDGNGYFDKTYDVSIATAAMVAGEAYLYLQGSGEVITSSTKTYFAVVDISGFAAIGNSISLGMPSAVNVTLAGIDVVDDFSAKATVTGAIRDPRIPTPPVVGFYKADNRLFSDTEDAFNAFRTLLKFKWTAGASQGAVEQAYYYIGAAPADDNTPAGSWVAAGAAAEVTIKSLSLLNNGNYYVSVKVKNSLGAYYSDIVSRRFVVDTAAPSLPSGALYITEEGSDKLLNWTSASVGVSGVEYYVVEERRGNSPLWVAISTTSDRFLPITAAGASPSGITRSPGSYFYRVYPVNNAGLSGAPSEPLAINIGLEQLSAISDASFYPNPFDSRKQGGAVAFTLNKDSNVTITIYDAFGQKVKSFGIAGVAGPNSVSWDGTGPSGKVSMGMYLCVIKAAGDSKILRIGVKH